MRLEGNMDMPIAGELAGSDRLVCEMVPEVDMNVIGPWSTIEFDAIHMSLRAVDRGAGPMNEGVRGDILVPSDGLFLRSLVQLFLQRRSNKRRPLAGHVLFLDRIAYPHVDSGARSAKAICTKDSSVKPLLYLDSEHNLGQDAAMLAAHILTKNLFPEAIGQPDPLHRADLGAKTLGRQINRLVADSTIRLRTEPLASSFRDGRDSGGVRR